MNAVTWARFALVVLVALVLQVGVLDEVVVLGAHPDVMVLLPIAAGLVAGPSRGAAVGFVTGLVADLVVQLPFGLSALAFVLVGFVAGLLAALPFGRDMPGTAATTLATLGAFGTALYALIGAIVGQPGMLSTQSVRAIVVVLLGGLVLALPVMRAMRWTFDPASGASGFTVPSGGSALG